jgi:membrane associated rhomboid family serine protease
MGALATAGAEPLAIVGATGASAAVLGGYLVTYQHGRVLCAVLVPFAVTVVAVPAVAFLAVWAALQVAFALFELNGAVDGDEAVTYLAPVAGLLFGAAVVKLFAVRTSPNYLGADRA